MVQTLTLIGSTRRWSQRETRETQQAYCISPGDMKGTVITGLVLSLINLRDEKQREAMADKNTHTETHRDTQRNTQAPRDV